MSNCKLLLKHKQTHYFQIKRVYQIETMVAYTIFAIHNQMLWTLFQSAKYFTYWKNCRVFKVQILIYQESFFKGSVPDENTTWTLDISTCKYLSVRLVMNNFISNYFISSNEIFKVLLHWLFVYLWCSSKTCFVSYITTRPIYNINTFINNWCKCLIEVSIFTFYCNIISFHTV